MGRALLIEESADLRNSVSTYLQERGIDIYTARGVSDARALLPALKPDVTTLDLDFADGDGFALIEDINRAGSRCLIVSERDQVQDRIRALALGADDYVAKPIHLEELYLRLRNIIANRRPQSADSHSSILSLNGLKIDLVSRALLNRDGSPKSALTETELSLLRVLTDQMDRIVSKEALSMAVNGRTLPHNNRSLDVAISRLRLKLKSTDVGAELRSVRQAGYMLSRTREAF
jgi:two-component system OmpR family response regulator